MTVLHTVDCHVDSSYIFLSLSFLTCLLCNKLKVVYFFRFFHHVNKNKQKCTRVTDTTGSLHYVCKIYVCI